jgi:superfamily I DNA/RNA helicase
MSDLPDDDNVAPTERLALPALDSFAAVNNLIALCIDPRSVKRHLRQLHDSLAAITAAQQQLEADRLAFDQHKAKQLAEIAEERATATQRLLAAQQAERSLEERRETVLKLERAWSGLTLPGEPPPLAGTLSRSRAYSGLERARYAAAHDGALPTHPDAEPDATVDYGPPTASPAPVRRGHGDSGDWPANVSMTKEPEAPGVRVRGRKPSTPPPRPEAT